MKILVMGASGKTGHEVVRQALAAGHEVTAFVRDPSRLELRDTAADRCHGRRAQRRRPATRARGAGRRDQHTRRHGQGRHGPAPGRQARRRRDGSVDGGLIEAAGEAGVRRVVMMSTFMLAPNFRAGILKPLALYYKGMNDDKRAGEEALKKSRLDWTIVYATRLTDGERTGRERLVPVTEIVTPRDNVSRSDAAAFLLAQLDDDAAIRKAIVCTAA